MRVPLSYWGWLLSGSYKLWQLIALGMIWVIAGLAIWFGVDDAIYGIVLIGCGVVHWLIGGLAMLQAMRADERLAALETPADEPAIPAKPEPKREVRHAPPRLGDDPFREPPAPPPIAVVRDHKPLPAAPIAEGNSEDKPRLLK